MNDLAESWLKEPPLEELSEPAVNPFLALVEDAADIMRLTLPPITQIIAGIVAESSKLVIGSGSKSFKTWITVDAGLSISHDALFLGRRTQRRRVLYVNLELRPSTFQYRVQTVARAKGITVDPGWLKHLPLRGQLSGLTVRSMVDQIIGAAKSCQAGVVIADPVYKLNVEGDENSSRDQTRFFNELDRITTEGECTLILNDHFSKGNQSEKDPLDAIRGSSAKGGDVDAAMVLRRHEVADCYRVDLVHRELPPCDPFVIGWDFPLMHVRDDLDAEKMKQPVGRQQKHDPLRLLALIKDHTQEKPVSINGWATLAGIPRKTLGDYTPAMRRSDWIGTTGEGTNARTYITENGIKAVAEWRAKQ